MHLGALAGKTIAGKVDDDRRCVYLEQVGAFPRSEGEEARTFNSTKFTPWARWVSFLGLGSELPNTPFFPYPAERVLRELRAIGQSMDLTVIWISARFGTNFLSECPISTAENSSSRCPGASDFDADSVAGAQQRFARLAPGGTDSADRSRRFRRTRPICSRSCGPDWAYSERIDFALLGRCSMPYRICWEQRSVDQILQTEALAGDDAVFLATHLLLRDSRYPAVAPPK